MASLNALAGAPLLALALILELPGHQAQAQNPYAQQEAPVIRVLLKSDAKSLFYTNRKAWVAKVDALIEAGHGKAKGSATTDLTLVMNTGVGAVLTLLPKYGEGEGRPESIEFSIAYRNPQATLISDPELEAAVSEGERQLRPEYAATGRYDRGDEGITVTFVIVEEG